MTPKEIIITLKLFDVTQTSIADRLHITTPAVNSVIKRKRNTPRIRLAIAEAIGRQVDQVFPPTEDKKDGDKQINHIRNPQSIQENSKAEDTGVTG